MVEKIKTSLILALLFSFSQSVIFSPCFFFALIFLACFDEEKNKGETVSRERGKIRERQRAKEKKKTNSPGGKIFLDCVQSKGNVSKKREKDLCSGRDERASCVLRISPGARRERERENEREREREVDKQEGKKKIGLHLGTRELENAWKINKCVLPKRKYCL